MKEGRCRRCGICCHYMWEGKLKPCKYLVDIGDGVTKCSVYSTRIGRILNRNKREKIVCSLRKNVIKQYKDCPYNKNLGSI